jgi:hypothetical protein
MFDLTQPVTPTVIIGSIVLIVALVGIGLGVVAYFKRRFT